MGEFKEAVKNFMVVVNGDFPFALLLIIGGVLMLFGIIIMLGVGAIILIDAGGAIAVGGGLLTVIVFYTAYRLSR